MKDKIRAFKDFNKNMTCHGFQYEEGKEYELKDTEKDCMSRSHACEHPLDCFDYYHTEIPIYKFPYEEYNIIGDTAEIDNILNSPGTINIDVGDIERMLSKDRVNYVSVGYGDGIDAISGAINEAIDNFPSGIDGIANLLIYLWIPPGSLKLPLAYLINFIETLPDLDVFWGITQGELPYCGDLKTHKVKVSLIAASK